MMISIKECVWQPFILAYFTNMHTSIWLLAALFAYATCRVFLWASPAGCIRVFISSVGLCSIFVVMQMVILFIIRTDSNSGVLLLLFWTLASWNLTWESLTCVTCLLHATGMSHHFYVLTSLIESYLKFSSAAGQARQARAARSESWDIREPKYRLIRRVQNCSRICRQGSSSSLEEELDGKLDWFSWLLISLYRAFCVSSCCSFRTATFG